MFQTIVVWVLIGISAAYLTRYSYRSVQSLVRGTGSCGSCGKCSTSKEPQPVALAPRHRGNTIALTPRNGSH